MTWRGIIAYVRFWCGVELECQDHVGPREATCAPASVIAKSVRLQANIAMETGKDRTFYECGLRVLQLLDDLSISLETEDESALVSLDDSEVHQLDEAL
jgi:hypothetical protein